MPDFILNKDISFIQKNKIHNIYRMSELSADQPQQLQSYLAYNKTLTNSGVPGPSDASIYFALIKIPNQAVYPNLRKWYTLMSSLPFAELSKLAQDFNSKNAAPTAYLKKQEFTAPTQPKTAKNVPKSLVIFDVKFYDIDVNYYAIAHKIYEIQIYGLTWNKQPKILPIAFGLCKLQIGCIIQDDKVTTDAFLDIIQSWDDDVQSVDIVAFQKV